MTTVLNILNYLNSIAPPTLREPWDQIGLNCGHADHVVEKVLVALDPFQEVCEEAVEWGAQLLVTHHPLIFEPGFITDRTPQGKSVLTLLENGIAHINAHTNLDQVQGGVNDVLAEILGLEHPQIVNPAGTDDHGNLYGLLRIGSVPQQSLPDFLAMVKKALGCPVLRYADGGHPVHQVAIGGGSCGSELLEAVQAGCDTFVTADVKYNQFWDARHYGVSIIDAGHFYTENPVCSVLAGKISAAFPDLSVRFSQKHRDCMKFF